MSTNEPDIKLAQTLATNFLSDMKADFWAAKPKGERGAIVAVLEDFKRTFQWNSLADVLVRLSTATEMTFDTWRQAARMSELADDAKLPVVLLFETDEGNLRGFGTLAYLTRPAPQPTDEPMKRRRYRKFGFGIPKAS